MPPIPLLIVCDFNGHGGTQTQVLELLASLRESPFRAGLATLTLDPDLGRRLDELDVPVTNLNLSAAVSLETWRAIDGLARLIGEEGIRLVHGFLFQGNAIAAASARRAGVPYLTSVRNLELWKRPHELAVSRWSHSGARRITFNSSHVRDLVCWREAVNPCRTRVIDNGLPPAGEAVMDPPDPWEGAGGPRLACVASLTRKKGHGVLLKAFAEIAVGFPGACLALVGSGPQRGALEEMAAGLGMGDQVRFAGRRSDARAIIAAADLLVLSSEEEGMPNVIIEAQAAGVPQVATAVGGTPETLEDGGTGYLVPPGDPALLAERVRKILSDGALRERLAVRSRALFGERFSVERMARSHEELYHEVLGNREAP